MNHDISYPTFYAEITCQTSPHPKRRFTVEVPRMQLAGTPFPVVGSFYGNEPPPANPPFLKIREYDVRKHTSENRFFMSFKGLKFNDAEGFLRYTEKEIERANRVISAVLPPYAAPIKVSNELYVADSENQMKQITEDYEIGETIRFETVDNVEIVDRWNEVMKNIVERKDESLFYLLENESKDALLGKCIALISENTYSSFYNVLEILKEFYGGHHKFIKMQGIDKEEASVFAENAQVYRHANHELKKREMPLAEAKLFMLKLLWFYVGNPHRVRR
jgi:hypothetical protein